MFGVDASQNGYTGDRLVNLYTDVIKRLAAVPGAEAASAARLRLFSGWVSNGAITIPGVTPKASMILNTNAVGPDFARTTGMRVIAGRDIAWSDIEGKRRVAVVTEEMARHFFDDLNVVGRRFSTGSTYDVAADYEIIGGFPTPITRRSVEAFRAPPTCRSTTTGASCAACTSTFAPPAIRSRSPRRSAP